ncbi:MAG: hypothetical protein J0I93_12505 [Legionella sp.]|nr:hypothetical protein [Legionella sp.]
MSNKFHTSKIFETLIPFIIAGIAIALFVGLLFMFSYVVIWGLIIGGVMWLISVIKDLLIPSSKNTGNVEQQKSGRIIEHDDKS